MAEHVHEWQLTFKPDSFRRVRCKHCPEQMLDYDIESRINEYEALKDQNAALLDVVRDCVNFLADLNTTIPFDASKMVRRAKALHKRAYTAHSKAKGE